jgi:hypothetical protein
MMTFYGNSSLKFDAIALKKPMLGVYKMMDIRIG